jgi:aminoglycoside 6'-N-acetyltransferase
MAPTELSTLPRPGDPLPIVTERTALRRLAIADLAAFQAYRHDPDVARYQGWCAEPDHVSLGRLAQMNIATLFAPSQWVQIGIADRASGGLIGDIGICVDKHDASAEIGFSLAAAWQGRGLAREAVAAAIAMIFGHTAVKRIDGSADSRNLASLRLLERLGMRRVRERESVFHQQPCVEIGYSIERADARAPTPADSARH